VLVGKGKRRFVGAQYEQGGCLGDGTVPAGAPRPQHDKNAEGYIKKCIFSWGFFGRSFQLCYGSVKQPLARPRNLNIAACKAPYITLLAV